MLSVSELAMNRKHRVVNKCCVKNRIWHEREEAQDFFLEMMMSADWKQRDQYEAVYIRLIIKR